MTRPFCIGSIITEDPTVSAVVACEHKPDGSPQFAVPLGFNGGWYAEKHVYRRPVFPSTRLPSGIDPLPVEVRNIPLEQLDNIPSQAPDTLAEEIRELLERKPPKKVT